MIIVVMGVSGSGKSTTGKLLAERLEWEFSDADDFHSLNSKEKMRRGIPLTDADRMPWLERLAEIIEERINGGSQMVLACSALKDSYRTVLDRTNSQEVVFVYLKVDFNTVEKRLAERKHEFMNPELLKSQFETLEEPGAAIVVDARQDPELVVESILKAVRP